MKKYLFIFLFLTVPLISLATERESFTDSRREKNNFGVDFGIGAPFFSALAVQLNYFPTKYVKTYASAGTFIIVNAVSVGADFLINPDDPVSVTAGLEATYAQIDDVFKGAFGSGDETNKFGLLGARIGGDWMTYSGFHMAFGMQGGMPVLYRNEAARTFVKSTDLYVFGYVQAGFYW